VEHLGGDREKRGLEQHPGTRGAPGPTQDIVLFLGFCARINTILCAPTLCLGTPPHPVIARIIAQYNVPPRPLNIAIYTTQYWQSQYCVKAKVRLGWGRQGRELGQWSGDNDSRGSPSRLRGRGSSQLSRGKERRGFGQWTGDPTC